MTKLEGSALGIDPLKKERTFAKYGVITEPGHRLLIQHFNEPGKTSEFALGGGPLLDELCYRIIDFEGMPKIEVGLTENSNYRKAGSLYSLANPTYSPGITPEMMEIIIENFKFVHFGDLNDPQTQKDLALEFLTGFLGEWDLTGENVMVECPIRLNLQGIEELHRIGRSVYARNESESNTIFGKPLFVLSKALEALGKEPEVDVLKPDFQILPLGLAEALEREFKMPNTPVVNKLTREAVEIYAGLRKEKQGWRGSNRGEIVEVLEITKALTERTV